MNHAQHKQKLKGPRCNERAEVDEEKSNVESQKREKNTKINKRKYSVLCTP